MQRSNAYGPRTRPSPATSSHVVLTNVWLESRLGDAVLNAISPTGQWRLCETCGFDMYQRWMAQEVKVHVQPRANASAITEMRDNRCTYIL